MQEPGDITQLLQAWAQGDANALDRLMPLVEQQLRRIAHNHIRREGPGQVLDTRALVNEAYLELREQNRTVWADRKHFYKVVAMIMRRILCSLAVEQQAQKRGGGWARVSFPEATDKTHEKFVEILALDEALQQLSAHDKAKSQMVELRYFVGCSVTQVAEILGFSESKVRRDLQFAYHWLRNKMDSAPQATR